MRAFVIADASKRKAKPVAALLWEESPSHDQGKFTLEVSLDSREEDLPLSLSGCLHRDARRATPEESEAWTKSRIVPDDRHNIVEVLRANGLSRFDEVSLLSLSKGRSSDDDLLAYEVDLPEETAQELAAILAAESPEPFADRLISSVVRQRVGSEVRYAFVQLEEASEETPAQHIGSQIRALRKSAGLTQKQLAAKAGITQTVLSRIESGAGNPTLSLLEEVAGALGANLDVTLS